MRKMFWILVLFSSTNLALAQVSSCADVAIFDPKLPIYPPITRVAHMQSIERFSVVVHPDGHSDISFLDGPSKGMFQVFIASSREFLESRRYGWVTVGEHQACTYIAEIEYRMLPEQADSPNNFMRVTDIDLAHTLVEVKDTKPTITY